LPDRIKLFLGTLSGYKLKPMNKGKISNLLRQLRILHLTDLARYFIQKRKNSAINREFRKNNPDVKLPPDYLIYESFQINYLKYYTESIETAKWIAGYFEKYIELKDKKILDWGCGPGRVIRHLPIVIGNECEYFGTDYNSKSIEWCSKNLPGISFNKNTLEAELPYSDNFFDVIYGISIFTHLSEQMHYNWFNELYRILRSGGIMFLSTQGDHFKVKLTDQELQNYNNGKLVVRGKVKEGHRTYSAFHPKEFMLKLFEPSNVLEHNMLNPEKGKWLPQDIWIVRK
jgi:ubiquinone/menaquinone biosynthesis C-methylase UbiE